MVSRVKRCKMVALHCNQARDLVIGCEYGRRKLFCSYNCEDECPDKFEDKRLVPCNQCPIVCSLGGA